MNSRIKEIWEMADSLIKDSMSPLHYKTWISQIEPYKIIDQKFYLLLPDKLFVPMAARFSDLIKNALYEVTGEEYEIVLCTREDLDDIEEKQKEKSSSNGSSSNFFEKYTFENYIVGPSNRFAHAACLAVAEEPANAYNPLFLYGGVGLGKTHLMHAVGNYVKKKNPKTNIVYVSAEQFTNELINSIKDNTNEAFRNKYRSIDFLLVDDIQFIAGKTSTEEEFFHTFNALHQANKQIILTSDRPPKEIKTLEERLRSRFEWGLICDIQPPDYETRIAILQKKAQDEGINISNEILALIAEKITSNIRELEGVFNRVIAYRGLVNKEITIDVAMEALKDYNISSGRRQITTDFIIESCAKYFRLKPEDIKSSKRTKELANARQIAMYLCRELTDLSLSKIAQDFGNKDHTTIMYGIKKIEKAIQENYETKVAVETLIHDIKGE